MKLTVWIFEPHPPTALQMKKAWQTVGGAEVLLFSALPAPDFTPFPDLFMAELQSHRDEVTQLLLALRQSASTDFLPVTADTSAATFTCAQQLGAIDYILKPFTLRRLHRSLRRYLALKQGLSASSILTQAELDQFFFSGERRKLLMPASLSDAEQIGFQRMLMALLRQRQLTVSEAASLLAVSHVTARKYLELVAAAGYAAKRPVYGAAGRPYYLYQLTTSEEL
ncbi:MAG: DeoR family transcriptional regulator [Lachnospiraceae bacterium]|jgi:response regulator of citrate/malate metabolism|nr:DeoR family transcriptional regulator [Lachnospiraceae bacterium]